MLILTQAIAVPCVAHGLTLAFQPSCFPRSPHKRVGLEQLAPLDPRMTLLWPHWSAELTASSESSFGEVLLARAPLPAHFSPLSEPLCLPG